MKRLLKNQRGFTLVELMMVIAVIGILAAVLIPKIGGLKTEAKLAGLDVNLRTVEGVVHQVIDKKNDASEVEKAILDRLHKHYDDVKNPFNNATGIATDDGTPNNNVLKVPNYDNWSEVTGNTNGAAFTYNYGNSDTENPTDNSDLAGSIYIQAYDDSGTLTVKLYPIDGDGKVISDDIVTITQ